MVAEMDGMEDLVAVLTAADLGGQGLPLWNYQDQVTVGLGAVRR